MPLLNALSVDVEDFFHSDAVNHVVPRECWELMPTRIEENVNGLLDLFARRNVKATFFFLGWIAERYPNLVALIHELGHELGCHSYWHRPIYWLGPEQFREDTYRARSVIEDAAGAPVYGYRAPKASITTEVDWAFEVLAELGFTYDASVDPGDRRLFPSADAWRFPYLVASGALLEVPMTTCVVGRTLLPVSTGPCLRMMPLSYIRHGIRQMNEHGQPAILQFEPADFDAEQPRMPIRFVPRLRQYAGLSRSQARLEALITEFKFGPMSQAFDTHFNSLEALAV